MSKDKKKNSAPKPSVESVNRYVSKCCGERADKPALVKTEDAEGSLGHWRCTGCRKPCKVTVYRRKKGLINPIGGEHDFESQEVTA